MFTATHCVNVLLCFNFITLSMLGKVSADEILVCLFSFYRKTGFDSLCVGENYHETSNPVSRRKHKKKYIINLSSAELAQRVRKVKSEQQRFELFCSPNKYV